METHKFYDGLQCDINHALDKLQHQNLLQQQTVHSIELDVQNLCLKLINLKNNQSELSEDISKLTKLAKIEVDLKDKLIAHLRKELDACTFLCKDNNTQYKREQDNGIPSLGKPPVKRIKTIDYETEPHNRRHKKHSTSTDTCKERGSENNGSSKYSIFDTYKCEVERKRIKKIEASKTSGDNSPFSQDAQHVDNKAKEINKISTETPINDIPKQNQSVEFNINLKNRPNTLLNVNHCNDKFTVENANNLHLNQETNKLNNKVNTSKKVMCNKDDRDDTKDKSMEELRKLREKANLQKSAVNYESKTLYDNLSNHDYEILTKYKNTLPILMLQDTVLNVNQCNDKVPAEKGNKVTENLLLVQGNNKLQNKVNTITADRDDTKAMNKLLETLKNLKGKQTIVDPQKSAVDVKTATKKTETFVNGHLSGHNHQVDNVTKNRKSLPMLILEEIATSDCVALKKESNLNNKITNCRTNDVTLTETINIKEIEKTPNTKNIINKIVAQEMKNIDINANEFKSSHQQNQIVEGEEEISQAKTTKKGKADKSEKGSKKAVKKTTRKAQIDKIKTSVKEAPKRILRSTLKKCNMNDQKDKLKKPEQNVKPDKTIEQTDLDMATIALDLTRNVKVSIPLNDFNLDDCFPVLHIPELENFVTEDISIAEKKLHKNSDESSTKLECNTAALILEKHCENLGVNIDILKEDLNISFLDDESDLQSSTNKSCTINCAQNSPDNNSLEKQSVHNTYSARRKRRRVVITMVD